MPVVVHRLDLSKADLSRLSDQEQKLFVIAGHISNELGTLQKILVGCMNFPFSSQLGKSAYAVQNWIVAKVIIGKLHEAYNAMRKYYFSGLSRTYHGLLFADAQAAEQMITEYFRHHTNPITTIRNSAAFHYNCEGIPAIIAALNTEQSFPIFLGEHDANSFYLVSEELMFAELFPYGSDEERRAAFDDLIKRVAAMARQMVVFFQGCMLVAYTRSVPDRALDRQEVEISEVAHIDFYAIPYFLDGKKNGLLRKSYWYFRSCVAALRLGRRHGDYGRAASSPQQP